MNNEAFTVLPAVAISPEFNQYLTASRGSQDLVPVVFALNTEVFRQFQALWDATQHRIIPAESYDETAADLLQDAIEIGLRMLTDEVYSYPLKPYQS